MIGWGDIYRVVTAMVPLYFAIALGYGSVRWWSFSLLLVVFEARQAWMEMAPPAQLGAIVEEAAQAQTVDVVKTGFLFWAPLLRKVGVKLARNPNVYAGILGVGWSSVANRWHLQIPSIIEGSISIMSKTGLGMGMFSMGLFIGQQDRFIVCGPRLTALSLALRFIAAPATTAAGALLLGLRGDLRRIAIAALPPSVATFNFAKQYDLHADVLSTAIIIGTLASLRVLIAFYFALGLIK